MLLCGLLLSGCCKTSRTSALPSPSQPAPIVVSPKPQCRAPGPRPLPPSGESLGGKTFSDGLRDLMVYVVEVEAWTEQAERYVMCMEAE